MKRVKKSERQKEILEVFFRTNQNPNKSQIASLGAQTGLSFSEVRNWFRNARVRKYTPAAAASELPSVTLSDLLMPSDAIIDHMTSVSDQTIPVGDHVIPFSDHVTPVGDIVAHVDKSGVSSPPTTANRVTSQLDKKCSKMKQFIETLNSFPAQSATRTTMLCSFVTNHLDTADKMIIHQRLLGNAVEEPSNKELRCHEVWSQLKHMFGHKHKQQESSQCDTEEEDMIGCLKELFKDHSDYLTAIKWLFQQSSDTVATELLQHCQGNHSCSGNPVDCSHGEQSVSPTVNIPATPAMTSTGDLLMLSMPTDNFHSFPTNHNPSGKEQFDT